MDTDQLPQLSPAYQAGRFVRTLGGAAIGGIPGAISRGVGAVVNSQPVMQAFRGLMDDPSAPPVGQPSAPAPTNAPAAQVPASAAAPTSWDTTSRGMPTNPINDNFNAQGAANIAGSTPAPVQATGAADRAALTAANTRGSVESYAPNGAAPYPGGSGWPRGGADNGVPIPPGGYATLPNVSSGYNTVSLNGNGGNSSLINPRDQARIDAYNKQLDDLPQDGSLNNVWQRSQLQKQIGHIIANSTATYGAGSQREIADADAQRAGNELPIAQMHDRTARYGVDIGAETARERNDIEQRMVENDRIYHEGDLKLRTATGAGDVVRSAAKARAGQAGDWGTYRDIESAGVPYSQVIPHDEFSTISPGSGSVTDTAGVHPYVTDKTGARRYTDSPPGVRSTLGMPNPSQ